MKKATIILLSLLMVLAVGQAAFAKGNINLLLGYEGYLEEDDGFYYQNGFKMDLSGSYYFTNRLSISGEVMATIFFDEGYEFTVLTTSLFGRYDIFAWNKMSLGVQLGIIDSMWFWGDVDNYFFIAPGLNAKVAISPKINFYTELNFPINCNKDFFKAFFYDITLGGTYEINSKLDLGIEANISNSNAIGHYAVSNYPDFTWGIGVKVGYSF